MARIQIVTVFSCAFSMINWMKEIEKKIFVKNFSRWCQITLIKLTQRENDRSINFKFFLFQNYLGISQPWTNVNTSPGKIRRQKNVRDLGKGSKICPCRYSEKFWPHLHRNDTPSSKSQIIFGSRKSSKIQVFISNVLICLTLIYFVQFIFWQTAKLPLYSWTRG